MVLHPTRRASWIGRACFRTLLGLCARVAISIGLTAQGQVNVLWPGDPVVASSLNSPGSDGAGNAIDGTQAKYLNFDSASDAQPSGFAVMPSIGSTLVTSMEIESGNDAPERDPREVTLEGSNDNILSFSEGTWTLIADIQVPPFTNRFQSQAFAFANTNRYSSYRWTVWHTQGPSTCCMQVGEVRLIGILPQFPPCLHAAFRKPRATHPCWRAEPSSFSPR
jgi:hypothetical protein